MDFRVIRRKPPPAKIESPPPEPTSPPSPPPPEMPPPPPYLPLAHAPHPHPHPYPYGPYPPLTDEMDPISRQQRLRSIEYSNARTWRMNFGEYPDDCHYGNYEYTYQPFGVQGTYKYDPHNMLKGPPPPPPRMALPPPDYHQYPPEYPQRMALPPPNYHHQALPDYQQRLGFPPPDYHKYGPMEQPMPSPPVNYYYPPAPYYGGLFSDENPNGCRIM